jgi:hypothetical protein
LSIKMKLIGGVSALAMAGGMLAVAVPPAGATVNTIGTCVHLKALGSAKSSTINPGTGKPYGITDNDNQDGAISSKGVNPDGSKNLPIGSCSFPSNSTYGVPNSDKPVGVWTNGTHNVTKWGTKLYSREFDCDVNDTSDNTEWSPSGTLSMTFADIMPTSGKNAAITANITVDGFTDNGGNPSDVVKFHGIVSKGAALGADVSGETEFDPVVKDKTQTTVHPYPGYQFDVAGALGCSTVPKGDANILAFVNGDDGAGNSELLALPVSGITFTKGTP